MPSVPLLYERRPQMDSPLGQLARMGHILSSSLFSGTGSWSSHSRIKTKTGLAYRNTGGPKDRKRLPVWLKGPFGVRAGHVHI